MASDLYQLTNKYKYVKKRFFERNAVFKKFKEIDEERKDIIKNNANIWLENHPYDNNIRKLLCLFNNLNDYRVNQRIPLEKSIRANELFDFTSNDEELLFYVFVSDPELKLLQINYEECTMENIKRRYREEFGIDLDIRLLKIETAYNCKFPTIEDEFVLSRTK